MTAAAKDSPPSMETRDDTRPVVPLPRAGLSAAAIVAGCTVLAVVLFLVLESGRRARDAESARSISLDGAITSPAPLQLPAPSPAQDSQPVLATLEPKPSKPILPPSHPAPPSAPLPSSYPPAPYFPAPPPREAAPASPASASNDAPKDPVLILDAGVGVAPAIGPAKTGDANQDALASDDSAIRATRIRNRTTLVPQGTIINAVLETPIDSTRSGLVRAVVARDTRGFDGTRVLIPRGSRLIGQAEGDTKPGQHRVLVEWSRLIRPDGVAIRIGSPASDTLGGAGINGHVNNHFFARFANAALQSALTAGVAIASRSSNSSYVYALPGPITSAGQSLFPDVPPGATIKVRAGAEIAVFVAHDLDFSGTTSGR